jgi:LepB N-terminal domain
LAKWAQRSMPDKFDKEKPENIKLEQVQEAFIERMVERQSSLKEYGLQIKLGLLIEQDKSKSKLSPPYKFKDENRQKEFAKLVKEYPEYFEKINDNPKLFKFRDKTLGKNALKFMQEQINTAVVVGIFPSKGELIGGKDGGAKESDPYGGKYKKNNDVYLVKRDFKKSQNDIAEYLAPSIFKEIAADHCPEVTLVKNESPKDPNKNSFIASKFFSSSEGYKDFHKEFGDEQRRTSGETTDYILGKEQRVKTALLNRSDDGSYKYEGYEQSVVTSLLVGDFSVHSGNLGVVNGKDESHKKLVRIDFGAAFRDFSSDINPHKSITSSLGQEKNYLLRDHPKERIMTKQFADELRRAASVPLEVLVEKQWDTIKDNFTPEAVQAFAKQIRVPGAKKGVEVSDEMIKKHFKETMQKRQQSLKNMACEIDIYRAMNTVGTKEQR